MSISGNLVGTYTSLGKTFIFVDEDGNELTGVCVDNPVMFTAGDNDVREGMVYASDIGVSTGTKVIPPYYVRYGYKLVPAGKSATITCPEFDYQNLVATVATYDTSREQSVVLNYVSIDNSLYSMSDNSKVADIVINYDNATIDLGINVNEKSILRYFVVREDV